jgi:hypothetical protein
MKNSLKKFLALLFPVLVFLIHLPFVFAKSGPIPAIKVANVYVNPNSLESNSNLYESLQLEDLGLSQQAFQYAIKGYNYLLSTGKLSNEQTLTIVDFSLPSSAKRLFVIDLENRKILYNTYVAHGRNSGKEYANSFSNAPESNKSSLGFYITKGTYNGAHGFSLKLEGEEKGINDNALSRAIVMHSADYVNKNLIRTQGYIGRSLGCPAIPKDVYKPIIQTIKDGSCLFIYGNNTTYSYKSTVLREASTT